MRSSSSRAGHTTLRSSSQTPWKYATIPARSVLRGGASGGRGFGAGLDLAAGLTAFATGCPTDLLDSVVISAPFAVGVAGAARLERATLGFGDRCSTS